MKKKQLYLTINEKQILKNNALNQNISVGKLISNLLKNIPDTFDNVDFPEPETSILFYISESDDLIIDKIKNDLKSKIKMNKNTVLRYLISSLNDVSPNLSDNITIISQVCTKEEKRNLKNLAKSKHSNLSSEIRNLIETKSVSNRNKNFKKADTKIAFKLDTKHLRELEQKATSMNMTKNQFLRELISSVPPLEETFSNDAFNIQVSLFIDENTANIFKKTAKEKNLSPSALIRPIIKDYKYDDSISYNTDSKKIFLHLNVSKDMKLEIEKLSNELNISITKLLKNMIYSKISE